MDQDLKRAHSFTDNTIFISICAIYMYDICMFKYYAELWKMIRNYRENASIAPIS